MIQAPPAALVIQLPANAPREAARDGSSAWEPAPTWVDLDGVPAVLEKPFPFLTYSMVET